MAKKITSYEGLFGNTIYRDEHGKKIGESHELRSSRWRNAFALMFSKMTFDPVVSVSHICPDQREKEFTKEIS